MQCCSCVVGEVATDRVRSRSCRTSGVSCILERFDVARVLSAAEQQQGFQRVGIGNVVAVVLMVRKARRSARWLSACRLGEACTLAWRMDGVGVDVDCGARMAQRGSHIAQPASVGRTGESSVDGQAVRKARGTCCGLRDVCSGLRVVPSINGRPISAAGLRALGRPASECRVRCAPRCRGLASSARMGFEREWPARARHVPRLCGSVMAGAALVGPWQPTRHRRDLGTCGPWVLFGLTVVVRFDSCDAAQTDERADGGRGEVRVVPLCPELWPVQRSL